MHLFRVFFSLLLLMLPVLAADAVSDDALYDRVRLQIANDRETGGGLVEVKVTDGVVELTGKVKTARLRDRTGKLAKKVKGVKQVVNKIQVSPV